MATFHVREEKISILQMLISFSTQVFGFQIFTPVALFAHATRASLMTGRYPDMVGVPGLVRGNNTDNWGYLLPSAVTLPDMMKKAGYQTAIIGKWNLGIGNSQSPQ